jgi:methylglyoxal synthase
MNTRNIVVMAHDKKKPELLEFLKEREEWLWGRTLIATGRSAEFLEQGNFKIPLKHLSPGKSGGYQQITEMIRSGEVDLVIFLRDHEVKQQHHEDIRHLLESCNVQNIPLATNVASAELLIIGLIRKEAAAKKTANKA